MFADGRIDDCLYLRVFAVPITTLAQRVTVADADATAS